MSVARDRNPRHKTLRDGETSATDHLAIKLNVIEISSSVLTQCKILNTNLWRIVSDIGLNIKMTLNDKRSYYLFMFHQVRKSSGISTAQLKALYYTSHSLF